MMARAVLMIEPIGFHANVETSDDNVFQHAPGADAEEIEARARGEFDALRTALSARGVEVVAFPSSGEATPDAVFPNNWFTTHADGRLILYPMRAANRRAERGTVILDFLERRYPVIVDLTYEEDDGRFLEGTGSLVIDEKSRVVYASESSRTDVGVVREWARRLGYRPIMFESRDRSGRPVYHTNVVLSLATRFAVCCLEAIVTGRDEVVTAVESSGREIVAISVEQMHAFCGNVLELEGDGGEAILVMSERARSAFDDAQIETIETYAEIVAVGLDTIERYGGGSARCMLAELN